MSTIQEIKQAVTKLSSDDLASFRDWFADFEARIWDGQFEKDARSGKLDKLANEAISEFRAGNYKEL